MGYEKASGTKRLIAPIKVKHGEFPVKAITDFLTGFIDPVNRDRR